MKKYFPFFFLLSIVLFLSFFLDVFNPQNIMNSPDEVANYLTIKEYAKNKKMFFEAEFLNYDYGNNLHQRGFLTWNGKIVPFNFLGMQIFFGPQYFLLQENIKIFLKLLMIFLIYFSLSRIASCVYGENLKKEVLFGIACCSPLLFYFNFFYFNIIPSVTFFLLFLYFLLRFNTEKNKKFLVISFFFAGFSVIFRYEMVIFIFLLLLINAIRNKELYLTQFKLSPIIFGILAIFLLFLLPLLYFNNNLYGSPFKYGYSAFNSIYFPNVREGSFIKSLLTIIIPTSDFSVRALFNNFLSVFVLLSPAIFFLSLREIAKPPLRNKIKPYWVVIFYFILYKGIDPGTYLSGAKTTALGMSTIRYWLILLVLMIIPFSHYLKQEKQKFFKHILALLIFLNTTLDLLFFNPNNLFFYKVLFENISNKREKISQIINTSDYLISINGKHYYDLANIVSWWGVTSPLGPDSFFSEKDVANLVKVLLENEKRVFYLLEGKSKNFIWPLISQGLNFKEISEFDNLYEVTLSQNEAE